MMSHIFYKFIFFAWSLTSIFQPAYANSTSLFSDAWEVMLDGDFHENIERLGGCEIAEQRLKTAIESGYDKNKAWMMIGICRSEKVDKTILPEPKKLCDEIITSDRENLPYILNRRFATSAFKNVQISSERYDDAQKWVTFHEASIEAMDRRCQIPHHPPLCFFQIKTYYEQIERGLEAELSFYCKRFLDDYDINFRASK